ncbi:hypothetical protein BC01_061 [Bacillus phage BC01]|nr:hypothetical protein BC01_061 [Bacillus phage BC01]
MIISLLTRNHTIATNTSQINAFTNKLTPSTNCCFTNTSYTCVAATPNCFANSSINPPSLSALSINQLTALSLMIFTSYSFWCACYVRLVTLKPACYCTV